MQKYLSKAQNYSQTFLIDGLSGKSQSAIQVYRVGGMGKLGQQYGNTGCGVFKRGGTKLERFLPKNQHTQRKLLNFENWVNGKVSKVPKFDFQSQFSMSKMMPNF